MVIDKAHSLRNSGTKVSLAVASSQVSRRLFLTAAPICNGLDDLGRLIVLAVPQAPDLDRVRELIRSIVVALAGCGDTDANMALLEQLTSKYLLAREDSVHETMLPKQVEQIVFVPLREMSSGCIRPCLPNSSTVVSRLRRSGGYTTCSRSWQTLLQAKCNTF